MWIRMQPQVRNTDVETRQPLNERECSPNKIVSSELAEYTTTQLYKTQPCNHKQYQLQDLTYGGVTSNDCNRPR